MGWELDHLAAAGQVASDLAHSLAAPPPAIAPGKQSRTRKLPPQSRRGGLRLEPGRLRFLDTRIGAVSAPQTVIITNPLRRPLAILDLIQQPGDGHGDEFAFAGMVGDPRLAPGGQLAVSFTFRPRPGDDRHRTGAYAIETSEGPLAMIELVGVARPALDAALTSDRASVRRGAEVEDQARRTAAWTRTARDPGPIVWAPVTYADLEAAFAAACELAEAGHFDEAGELVAAVDRRLRELTHPDRVHRVLDTFDISPHAPTMELGTAKDAVSSLNVRISGRFTVKAADLVAKFQVGGKMLRLLTGESQDAAAYQAFDRATWVTAGVAAAPLAVAAVVAAPELVGPLVTRAMVTVATESGLLWAATRGAFAWAFNYCARHPDEAAEWAQLFVGMGFAAGEDPEQFLADLQSIEGWNNILRDVIFAIGPVRGGGGGPGGGPGGEPPQRTGGSGRRGGGDHAPAADDAGAGRVLPPAVRRGVDGEGPGVLQRAHRLGVDGLDRMRALADAIRTRKQALTVPRARSSAARDGDDHPQTPADDATPVPDADVSFRERRDQALHKRRVARAAARDELYEAERAESAILVADLRREGGKVVQRVDDDLTGDTFLTIEMPNRRRVSIREKGNAPPRVTQPADPQRAGALAHEASQAKEHNRQRDALLAEALARSVEVDAAGAEHVMIVADKVIAGGGPAAVMDYATLPGRRGKVVAADGQEDVDVQAYAISDQPEVSWDGRATPTGQPPGEYAKLPLSVAPGDLLDGPTRYTPAQAYADAATITRDRTGMPVLRGWRVVAMDSVPDATWKVAGAARRLRLEDGAGRVRYVYARTVDLVGGLGPPRRLADRQYGAPAGVDNDPGAAARRAELEGAGVVITAEAHLSAARPVDKVLIAGGGATSPWNGALVARHNPEATIHWAARAGAVGAPPARAQIQQNAERANQISRELTAVELDLTLSFDPPERARLLDRQKALREEAAYLAQRERDLQFGDAMLDRNLDPEGPFANPNVTMFVKAIDTVTPVHDGDRLRARVQFSDGTTDVYDQVILNYGSDNAQPGSAAGLATGEQLGVRVTGKRAHLASDDGAVRVLGAASFTKLATSRVTPRRNARGQIVPYPDDAGFARQPKYSRDVPSFVLAGEQIGEANGHSPGDGDEP